MVCTMPTRPKAKVNHGTTQKTHEKYTKTFILILYFWEILVEVASMLTGKVKNYCKKR